MMDTFEQKNSNDVVIHEIPHLEQASSWDCGLTCILMILPSHLADNFQLNKSSICSEEFHNQSTWTIDLCYVLSHFSVEHKYYTKTIGINPSFCDEKFYNNFIVKDELRVNSRFKDASSKGIKIENIFLEMEELLSHLERNGLVIVLTDANLLDCQNCRSVMHGFGTFVKSLFHAKLPFNGHYIVVCGFDREKQLIYYKDPAVKSEICCLTFSGFEKARKAHGTDDDVILIFR